MDMQRFIRRAGLSLSCEPAAENPDLHPDDIPDSCEHFLCALRGRTHEMSFYFTSLADEGAPDIEDALRYLGSVAVEYESCDDLEDWADEHELDGTDPDTKGAYEGMARLTRDLWRVVGDDLYDDLRKEVEIEQAVDMALAGFVRTRSG